MDESSVISPAESAAHRELKRLAWDWACARRMILGATEVRLPRANYRADVVTATPRILATNAVTAVFECKVSRADFLRDRIPRELVERNFGRALVLAMNLAQSREAAALPGWRRHPPQNIPHRTNITSWLD